MAIVDPATNIGEAGVRQLRHDLLNPLNVLFGMTTVLLQTELTETQRTCVQGCRNAAQRLLEIAQHLETYQHEQPRRGIDGPAQLADLCSIAVARVDKPFDRDTLLGVDPPADARNRRLAFCSSTMRPRLPCSSTPISKAPTARSMSSRDGERAVAQAASQPYDLVLMDVDLPGLDGATAAHAIRAADLARGARPTPVVALSAMGSGLAAARSRTTKKTVVVLDDPDTAPLVPAFLDNRREDVHQMRELLEQGDFARIQSIGHKMKGTGRSYGFTAISRIGADIEGSGHQQDAPALERLINDLNSFLSRVQSRRTRRRPRDVGRSDSPFGIGWRAACRGVGGFLCSSSSTTRQRRDRASLRRILLTGATLAGLLVATGCGADATAKYTDTGVTREDGFVAAAAQGDVAAVNAFLNSGVSVDARDQHGSTALMAAAGSARIDLINTLVAKGADVNASKDDGWNALIAAAQAGSVKVVRALLDAGAKPDAGNAEGYTALMAAAQTGQADVVDAILEKDVDVNVANRDGWTALMAAIESGNGNIVRRRARKRVPTRNAATATGGRRSWRLHGPRILRW